MEKYLLYSYFDDDFNYIAVFEENTPKDVLEKAKQKYKEVRIFEYEVKD